MSIMPNGFMTNDGIPKNSLPDLPFLFFNIALDGVIRRARIDICGTIFRKSKTIADRRLKPDGSNWS